MTGFTIYDSSRRNLHPLDESRKKVSKQAVIDLGMSSLHAIGSDHICNVCIANSGSCCNGCQHLANGSGCQLRNTSCTAWLCGFLKYVLYETGYLQEWYDFWNQVPGQDYRKDSTPESVFIQTSLHLPNMRELNEALASDLQELAQTHMTIGFIITLREEMDQNLDRLMNSKNDRAKQARIKRKINIFSSYFHRFHRALKDYRQNHLNI